MNIYHYQLDIDTPSIMQIMASNNSFSSSNSSNEDMSLHLGRLYISDNFSNIRLSNSRIKSRKTEAFDFTQTWHVGIQFSSQSANSSSRSLINSQRSSGSRVNSQDKLHQRILQRNHNLQNASTGLGPNSFAQTCHPILLVNSSDDSDNSPNSSRDRDLNLEQAIQPHLYHSSPSNSVQELPPLHFSGSSNESLENRPPSLNYYGNSM